MKHPVNNRETLTLHNINNDTSAQVTSSGKFLTSLLPTGTSTKNARSACIAISIFDLSNEIAELS